MSFLTTAYALANRSGVFNIPGAYRLFTELYFAYKARLEDPFGALLDARPELFTGGHIVDVGANIGYTAGVFLRGVESAYRVFALEPDARNFATLRRTAQRAPNARQLITIRSAAGDRDGYLNFWNNRDHHADHRIATPALVRIIGVDAEIESIEVRRVDTVLAAYGACSPVAFIKIDVQGFELPVCLGMEATLRANHDMTVAVEYCPQSMRELGFNPEQLLDFFVTRGMSICGIAKNGSLQRFDSPAMAAELRSRGYIDLLCSRRILVQP